MGRWVAASACVQPVRLAMIASERADLTVVADEHLPPPSDRCRRRLVVRNLPDLSVVGIAGTTENAGPPRAVYVGDVRRSRGLETMIEAVAGAESWVLDIVGPVDRDDAGMARQPDRCGPMSPDGFGCTADSPLSRHGASPTAQPWARAPRRHPSIPRRRCRPRCTSTSRRGWRCWRPPLPRVERLLAEAGAGEVVRDAAEAARLLRHWAGPGSGRTRAPARGRSGVAAHPGVVGIAVRRTGRGASDNVPERRPRRREPALRRRYDASSTRRAAANRIEMELDVDEIGGASQTSDGEHGS